MSARAPRPAAGGAPPQGAPAGRPLTLTGRVTCDPTPVAHFPLGRAGESNERGAYARRTTNNLGRLFLFGFVGVDSQLFPAVTEREQSSVRGLSVLPSAISMDGQHICIPGWVDAVESKGCLTKLDRTYMVGGERESVVGGERESAALARERPTRPVTQAAGGP